MKINKLILIVFGLLLMLGTAACSGSGDNTSVSSPTSSSSESPAESANTDVSAEPAPADGMDFDMGGRTIKVVAWWDMTIPEDNPDNIKRKENLAALEKKHNFKIEYVAVDYGEYKDKVIASLLAGEPLGDLVRMQRSYMIPALVKQDLFWPLDEYTKNEKVFDQRATKQFSEFEGKGYGFDGPRVDTTGIFYNRTLMKKLGMKDLQEYVNEDTWNWDTFIQVAKDANRDTDNNGKLDTWGLSTASILEPAMAANETDYIKGDQQNLEDPKTIEAFNFISKLSTEKVARPTEGGDWTEPSQFFRQGNVLMAPGAKYETEGIKKDLKDYDIGFLPFPKGPSASTYHGYEGSINFLTIPKKSQNPDQLVYIWEKINDIDSMYDYANQGELERLFDNQDDINNVKMTQENVNLINWQSFPSMPYWDLAAAIASGESVSTVVEKFKAPFQSAIDEVYKAQ